MSRHDSNEQKHANHVVLAQYGENALLARYTEGEETPNCFIVAYGFEGLDKDWRNGSYHDVWYNTEISLRDAIREFYGESEKERRLRINKNRAEEIATHFKDLLVDEVDDNDRMKEIIQEMKSDLDLSESEISFYDLEKYMPCKKYRVTLEIYTDDGYWDETDCQVYDDIEFDEESFSITVDCGDNTLI